MNGHIKEYLDSIGESGSTERLGVIANMNLGERSEAARRVCEKRAHRQELMSKGFTIEQANIIINNEKQ